MIYPEISKALSIGKKVILLDVCPFTLTRVPFQHYSLGNVRTTRKKIKTVSRERNQSMDSGESHSLETVGAHKILCMLAALRHFPAGAVIYRQVECMLEDLQVNHQNIERACLTFATQLLDAYLGHLREGSPLQVQVRLLQARLQPPLTSNDLKVLSDYVDLYASQIEVIKQLDSDMFYHAVEPLLAAFGIIDLPSELSSDDVSAREVASETELLIPAEKTSDDSALLDIDLDQQALANAGPDGAPQTDDSSNGITGNQVDSAYRSHLDSKRRDIHKLQVTLAEQVSGTVAQNEEFCGL